MKSISFRSFISLTLPMLLISCFGLPMTSYCDDAAFLGDGASVYPIEHTEIQMVSENIKITKGEGHGWGVDVTMVFKNHGNATKVQMGFPFDAHTDESGGGINPHFRAYLDGKELKVTKKKGIKNPKLDNLNFPIVYTFDVAFEQDETKTIRHTYSVGGKSYTDSYATSSFAYILRTGALWNGPIENVNISAIFDYKFVPKIDCINFEESRSEKQGDKIILHWELKNIKPQNDLIISSSDAAYADEEKLTDASIKQLIIDKKKILISPSCERRKLRNKIMAYHGYSFKNQFVRAQFYYPGSPYKEDPLYAKKKIPKRDLDYIQFLAKIENWQKLIEKSMKEGLLPSVDEKDKRQASLSFSSMPNVLSSILDLNIKAVNNKEKIAIGYFNHIGNYRFATRYLVLLSWPELLPNGYIELSQQNEWSQSKNEIEKLQNKKKKTDSMAYDIPEMGPAIISQDGKYFCFIGKYQSKPEYQLVIVDISNKKIASLNESNIHDYYSKYIRCTKDSRALVTLTGAYDLATGQKIKSFKYENNERVITGGDTGDLFFTYNQSRIISIFDISILERIRKVKYDGYESKLDVSPDGKYLAGIFSNEIIKKNQVELKGAVLKIFEFDGNALNLIYQEEVISNTKDYHYNTKASKSKSEVKPDRFDIAFSKTRNSLFVIKSAHLYKYDIKPDNKIEKIIIDSRNDDGEPVTFDFFDSNNSRIQGFRQKWDLDSGRKIEPYWEMVDQSDKSNMLNLYGEKQ